MRGTTTSYYLHDGQNSVRTLTDVSCNVTDSYLYDAYSNTRAKTGTTVNAYQYTGQQFDSATNLYDLRARYFSSSTQFLSRDTADIVPGNAIELNRYTYTASNPINAVDPSGQALIELNVPRLIQSAATSLSAIGSYLYAHLALVYTEALFSLGGAPILIRVIIALTFGVVSPFESGQIPPGDKEIDLVGFQGNMRARGEALLVQVGHVGVSFDGGDTIYGFRPTDAALEQIGDNLEFLRSLRDRMGFRGGIYNDTGVFQRANELGQEVWRIPYVMSEEEFNNIFQEFQTQLSDGPNPGWYSFPPKNGDPMPLGCNNCATWPKTLGLDIPEDTGNLQNYMQAFKNVGKRWP